MFYNDENEIIYVKTIEAQTSEVKSSSEKIELDNVTQKKSAVKQTKNKKQTGATGAKVKPKTTVKPKPEISKLNRDEVLKE